MTLLRRDAYGDRQDVDLWEDNVDTRRHRIESFEVAEDGTVELPEGAMIIVLEFGSQGPYGYKSRPVTAWAAVPG
jgi:hypothetical protein